MAKKTRKSGAGPIYSTESGPMCPHCRNPATQCSCRKEGSLPQGDGIVRLQRQTKGRKGKGVTLVTGVVLESGELKKLAKSLKKKCGSGGSVKNGIIEIQGDHRDTLEQQLRLLGYKVKRAGG